MTEQAPISSSDNEEMISIPKKDYERFLTYEAKIDQLQHQLEKLQRLFHGSKTERFIASEDIQHQATI
jgi:hypothetical protein